MPSLITSVRPTSHSLLPISNHSLPIWFKFVNLYFYKSSVQGVVLFSQLLCLQLRYVTDRMVKTAALICLTITSHSETQNKMALPESNYSIQLSNTTLFISVCLLYFVFPNVRGHNRTKCKKGVKEPFNIGKLRYKGSWCLVHFSTRSQISSDSHTVTRFVLAGKQRAIYLAHTANLS